MPSVIRFQYDPFVGLFNDVLSASVLPRTSLTEGRQRPWPLDSFRPKVDLYESKDSDVVTAAFELPGIKSEDVTIEVRENRLTVSGEIAASDSREEDGYAVRERRYGKFSRSLRLPIGIKSEDVKAKMENGLLSVTFPKASTEQQPHRIAVQSTENVFRADNADDELVVV